MKEEENENILDQIRTSLDHPLFYPHVYSLVAKEQRKKRKIKKDILTQIIVEEFEELSRRLDRSKVQESCSVRNVLRSRLLAQLLIDEKGEFKPDLIEKAIVCIQNHLYSLGPERQYDGKRQEHILKVLRLIKSDEELIRLFRKVSKPFLNKSADELIRQTLQLPSSTVLTDAHARKAVLSAWFCTLRQNVGSCFATAPAEIVHDEQPPQFLQDMVDLIATGALKRTVRGVVDLVPMSTSWGNGDLKKPLVISHTSNGITPDIWLSPGLIEAFEAAEMINPSDKAKQKIDQLEGLFKPILSEHFIITAEELIRLNLLHFIGITENQLIEFENRHREMAQTSMIFINSKRKAGSIGEKCALFLQLFEKAKHAFKALSDNPLLKVWEFTVASFSDVKHQFTKWNLYASLGLEAEEAGGIGPCIRQTIQHKLDEANHRVQEIQYDYERAYTQVKGLESRMKHVSTEKEAQWLKVEYQGHANEFYFLQEQRDEAQKQAAALVNLYDQLYASYVNLFQDYFQEVYDADMQEVATGPFDDSPAGFRLLYKHGRSNTSQWTLIRNQHDFIDSLTSFFVATEPQIAHELEGKKIEKDLSDVVTAIINHLKTKEFLESAFHRMAFAHKVPAIKHPLDHLDRIVKKPWAYTSGGTMNTLIRSYYKMEDPPSEVGKWVENEIELLVFFVDTIKKISPQSFRPFLRYERESILISSPTHAFLLKPMLYPFQEAWSSDEYTYTSIRDRFVRPAESFIEHQMLNDEMIDYLIQKLNEKVAENYQPRFKNLSKQFYGPLNPIFFREQLVHILENDRGLMFRGQPVLSSHEIDAFLYSELPLFPLEGLYDNIGKIFSMLPEINQDMIKPFVEQIPLKREFQYMGSSQLKEICKALCCLALFDTTASYDVHHQVSLAAQKLKLAMPAPIIFADSNWVKEMFGFVLNPGSGKYELWRMDYTGSKGFPMFSWKQWLDGSRPDKKWAIYDKPAQYGQF